MALGRLQFYRQGKVQRRPCTAKEDDCSSAVPKYNTTRKHDVFIRGDACKSVSALSCVSGFKSRQSGFTVVFFVKEMLLWGYSLCKGLFSTVLWVATLKAVFYMYFFIPYYAYTCIGFTSLWDLFQAPPPPKKKNSDRLPFIWLFLSLCVFCLFVCLFVWVWRVSTFYGWERVYC